MMMDMKDLVYVCELVGERLHKWGSVNGMREWEGNLGEGGGEAVLVQPHIPHYTHTHIHSHTNSFSFLEIIWMVSPEDGMDEMRSPPILSEIRHPLDRRWIGYW